MRRRIVLPPHRFTADRGRRSILEPLSGAVVAALVAAATLAGCTRGSGGTDPRPQGSASDAVTVASFNFPESETLAEIYAQTLEASGVTVHRELDLGPRELVMPALIHGLVDFVPEYSGSALEFLDGGSGLAVADERATAALLARSLARQGLTALAPAPAEDQNAFAVTHAVSDHLRIRTISDLADHAPDFTIGGPPECPERPLCLEGLGRTYGLRFGRFLQLDTGGAVAAALAQGSIDVGVLFSTDGVISQRHFVVLDDDLGLQPAENVTPVVRTDTFDRIGTRARERIDDVSAALTTGDLREMNARVAFEAVPPARAASDWLLEHGLPSAEPAG